MNERCQCEKLADQPLTVETYFHHDAYNIEILLLNSIGREIRSLKPIRFFVYDVYVALYSYPPICSVYCDDSPAVPQTQKHALYVTRAILPS